MGLIKKHLTTQGILSTGRAQHGERAGRKTRTGIGNKPQTLNFSMLPYKLGRDGSLLGTLENKKPGLTNKGLGSTKLEPSLQWV